MSDTLPFSQMIGPLAVAFVFLAVLIVVRRMRKGPRMLRMGLYILLLLGAIEFAIFRNPVALRILYSHLSVGQLGWKQRDSLRLDWISKDAGWNKPYLALGSSQTHAIFNEQSRRADNLGLITSAGMSPVEAWWYRDLLKQHCSDTIILYLSEFDLVRGVELSTFQLSPRRSVSDLLELSGILKEAGVTANSDLAELFISNQLATYRYQFLAQGVIKKVAEKIGGSEAIPAPPQVEEGEDPIETLVDAMNGVGDRWFSTNVDALDRLCSWAATNDLRIAVVHGGYHPEAQERLKEMRTQATEALVALCNRHDHVRFIDGDDIPLFESSDYKDTVHVDPEAGARFTARLLQHLDEANRW